MQNKRAFKHKISLFVKYLKAGNPNYSDFLERK